MIARSSASILVLLTLGGFVACGGGSGSAGSAGSAGAAGGGTAMDGGNGDSGATAGAGGTAGAAGGGHSDSGVTAGTGGTAGAGGGSAAGAGGMGGAGGAAPARATLSGDVTWNVTFDATAKAAGATDCSYTRHYDGVEDRSAPWLCPGCAVMFRAAVQLSAGQTCYDQVTGTTNAQPAAEEWVGYDTAVPGGTPGWWRGPGFPMSQQGSAVVTASSIAITNSVQGIGASVGGSFDFNIDGQFAVGTDQGDVMNGFVPPATYSCGWPKANPPPYQGDYKLVKGQTMPDGLFHDTCGETVRLHDFKGSYLLVEMAAADCTPCQIFAEGETQFVQDMAAKGITVHVVTLLAPSLSDPFGTTTSTLLGQWTSKYGLAGPVLADRAWGYSMFQPVYTSSTGYPAWVLVRPDLTVLDMANGFGGFATIETTIQNDATSP